MLNSSLQHSEIAVQFTVQAQSNELSVFCESEISCDGAVLVGAAAVLCLGHMSITLALSISRVI